MRRTQPQRALVLGTMVAIVAITLVGAGPFDLGGLGFGGTKKGINKKGGGTPAGPDESIANVSVIRRSEFKVEGIGLVVGLSGTGSSPAPGTFREKLVGEMKKAQVDHIEALMASKEVSMVIIKVTVPTGVTKEDHLDVEVSLPPGSTTTSLAGGTLLMTRLAPMAVVSGDVKEGQVLAVAHGPILVGSSEDAKDEKVGRVLGGGRALKDIPYTIELKESRKSFRTSYLIQGVVNTRFYKRVGVDQKGMANAKTDELLMLEVPRVYHHNQSRYAQVLKLMYLSDSTNLRKERLDKWGKELLDPKTAGIASLRLEGLGTIAADTLKIGLSSTDTTVQFFAAEALAYMGSAEGVDVLAESAIKKPEFRAFALAALSAMDQSAAYLRLRALLNEPEVELRYGAFNALRTLDETDRYLGRLRVIDAPAPPPSPEDGDELNQSMAIQIARAKRNAANTRQQDPFALYVVDCEGPPLLHVANSRRCEIVLFGKNQTMLTPIVLGGSGSILLNASDESPSVQISHFATRGKLTDESQVTSSLDIARIVREMANIGASYPEIVDILISAQKQKNLPGPLVVDAVPVANPLYDQAQLAGGDTKSKKDDKLKKTKVEADPKRKNVFQRIFPTTTTKSKAAPKKDEPKEPVKADEPKSDADKPAVIPISTKS